MGALLDLPFDPLLLQLAVKSLPMNSYSIKLPKVGVILWKMGVVYNFFYGTFCAIMPPSAF